MLTVHLLGHAHVTQNGQPVPLSAKAVALIAYLAAEKLPQHRERLADLLWNTAEARTNLRVELARIRSAGLNIFPASRQLLSLESVGIDVDQWYAQHERPMNQTELAGWLSTLRGLPLCGLEDLGSTAFQVWVEQQQWMLTEKVEHTLARVYARYARAGQDWATRMISSRAEAVGFADPAETSVGETSLVERAAARGAASPGYLQAGHSRSGQTQTGQSGAGPDRTGQVDRAGQREQSPARPGHLAQAAGSAFLPQPGQSTWLTGGSSSGTEPGGAEPGSAAPHFVRPREERKLQALLGAAQPQIVLLHGPPGSGKTYLAERLAQALPPHWEVLRLSASRSSRLLLAALAQALLRVGTVLGGTDQVQILRQVLLQPGTTEEDMVKVAVAFSQIGRPLLLVLDEAHAAPAELTGLLELICQMPSSDPRLLLLLSREDPARQAVTRNLTRRLPDVQVLPLSPVTLGSVQQVLSTRFSAESPLRLQSLASRLTQRSEGNPLHLLSLLATLPSPDPMGRADLAGVDLGSATLPQVVRDTLRSEPEGWTDPLRDAMSRLSVVNGAFGHLIAQAVLSSQLPERHLAQRHVPERHVPERRSPERRSSDLESDRNAVQADQTDVLLCAALEGQILCEVDAGVALQLPELYPVRILEEADTQYMFRSEALRVTLAGQLPGLVRQDVRRRLATALTESEPGLASYYAERVGLQEQAGQLWAKYQAHLPQGSPLLSRGGFGMEADPAPMTLSSVQASVPRSVPEPVRQASLAQHGVSHQGYSVSMEGGWLSVMSDGRYGHPQTLTLRLGWPRPGWSGPLSGTLRLVWRLDVFNGGEELRPSLPPFPLRLTPVRPGVPLRLRSGQASHAEPETAFTFTPRQVGEYHEGHLTCKPQPGVVIGQWMEHHLGGPDWQGATGLDLSVRALDVALTIGVIEVTPPGQADTGPRSANLLVSSPPGTPVRLAVATQTGS
ncbi:AAA family ATPase [Deinococcus altitudinis]|uniref:AAA family ATPase n=1 Tax=Deinococcus altitudinis TaxID=468914 RepID=UPI00389292DD